MFHNHASQIFYKMCHSDMKPLLFIRPKANVPEVSSTRGNQCLDPYFAPVKMNDSFSEEAPYLDKLLQLTFYPGLKWEMPSSVLLKTLVKWLVFNHFGTYLTAIIHLQESDFQRQKIVLGLKRSVYIYNLDSEHSRATNVIYFAFIYMQLLK